MKSLVVLSLLGILAAPAMGEIWAWQDDQGTRRFTNQKDFIPDEYRDNARILVPEIAPEAPAEPEQRSRRSEPPPEPRAREAQVVYDQPPPSSDYERGLVTGMRLGSDDRRLADLLERSSVVEAPSFNVPRYYYPQPLYTPYVSPGFDQGRWRHRTLRMGLQEEFQAERWPYPPWAVGYVNGVPYPNWTRTISRPSGDGWNGKRLFLR